MQKPTNNNNNNQPSTSKRGPKHPKQIVSDQPVDEETITKPKKQPSKASSYKGLRKSLGRPDDVQDAFKPRALDPQGSAEKNDPLILESILVEGLTAGVACERQRTFQNDYSQYQQIVISSYRVMTAQDRAMRKYMSISMYNYYANVLLWKRLLYVLTEKGQGVNEYEAFVRKLPPMSIPNEIGIYLQGIGNLTDFNKRHYFLELQAYLRMNAVDGIAGHFGRVDEHTHIGYETLPAPFISILRLLNDCDFTIRHQAGEAPNQDWNLPADIRPAVAGLIPNRNLLGWDRSQRLTNEQLASLEAAQIYSTVNEEGATVFHTDGIENFNGYPIVYPLLVTVSEALSSAKSNQARYNDYASTTSYKGSLGQTGFQVRRVGQRNAFGYALLPIYERESTAYCYSQASVHMFSAASVCRYRVRRTVHGSNDSLCYTGPQGGAPHGWAATADDVYNTVENWNIQDFRTTEISGRQADDKFSENIRKIAPTEAV